MVCLFPFADPQSVTSLRVAEALQASQELRWVIVCSSGRSKTELVHMMPYSWVHHRAQGNSGWTDVGWDMTMGANPG